MTNKRQLKKDYLNSLCPNSKREMNAAVREDFKVRGYKKFRVRGWIKDYNRRIKNGH